MKILNNGIAILDADKDNLLSVWVEQQGRLDHDRAIQDHYCKYIRTGDVVIDAGAAIGDHTIAYIKACGDPGLVHAFEPHPLMLECLLHNCPKCFVHGVGLSDKRGSQILWHSNMNAGASYIGKPSDGYDTPFQIKLVPLDNLELKKVDFIKMDIEGYECKAIKGGYETLERCRPKMVIEVNTHMLDRAGNSKVELFELLVNLNYGWRVEMGEELSRAEYFCFPVDE